LTCGVISQESAAFKMTSTDGIGSMKLPDNCECTPSISKNFDYYSPIPVENSQGAFFEERVTPTNGLASDPYEFVFESMGDHFMMLNTMHMVVKAKITHSDGRKLLKNDEIAPVNNMLNSMWETVETRLNDVVINPATSYNIPYKSMIENILSLHDSKQSFIQPSMFVMDSGKSFDITNDANLGFKRRKAMITVDTTDHIFEMAGPICNNFLRSENHLAPGNKLSLRFTRASDAFCLMAGGNKRAKMEILDIALYVRRIRLSSNALKSVLKLNTDQKYLTAYTEVREYPLTTGIRNWRVRITAGGHIPKQVVVGFVLTEARMGSFSKNPFNFQHFNLSSINLKKNGTRIPQEPLTPDFARGRCQREYNHLFMNTGKYRTNSTNCITIDNFKNGCTLFPFDVTVDQCNMHHMHAGSEGTLDVEVSWQKALEEAITVIVYSASNQAIMVNPNTGVAPTVSIF